MGETSGLRSNLLEIDQGGIDAETNSRESILATKVIRGGELSSESRDLSRQYYDQLRADHDEVIKVGLFGEDLDNALQNPNATLIEYQTDDGLFAMPLLVPSEELEWYNQKLLRETFGQEPDLYYFCHPYIPKDDASRAIIHQELANKLDQGAVIFMDRYVTNGPEADPSYPVVAALAGSYVVESLGRGEPNSLAEAFAGPLHMGDDDVKPGPNLYQMYEEAVINGEIASQSENGTSLVAEITGEEAEQVWNIYKNPFDALTRDHPMENGFDKSGLLELLADPEVAKVVHRVEGSIKTLLFCINDFEQCPWFNMAYYEQHYPDYTATNNVWMFPSIVTDDEATAMYSGRVIGLACKMLARRATNALITFECTEISAQYIPRIVNRGVRDSGFPRISELDRSLSTMDYICIKKKPSVS